MIVFLGSVAILTIGGLVLNQIYNNHQSNNLIIEKCFNHFNKEGEIVIKKDGFWSPVACESK
ncbi:hypothetical protein [Bacillus sp. B1-b2]|uniref:hypothetical protein n=1 Tax=Bacillus sp. B1-b2 TaxID=2653201 RepID=UPI001D009A7F|nr:hypothetical protein [Bacillus sp. B1-b2]